MAEKKFLLRLDHDLYEQVTAKAKSENRSINNYIVHLLQESTKQETFENRQIVGQTIKGSEILTESGLVSVHGIYYRYILNNGQAVDVQDDYTIIEANGSILTLEPIK